MAQPDCSRRSFVRRTPCIEERFFRHWATASTACKSGSRSAIRSRPLTCELPTAPPAKRNPSSSSRSDPSLTRGIHQSTNARSCDKAVNGSMYVLGLCSMLGDPLEKLRDRRIRIVGRAWVRYTPADKTNSDREKQFCHQEIYFQGG
jgi:hypothetical protein